MRRRALGNTGINVSELSLGTWGLSGGGYGSVEADEMDRVIDRALELGIDLFDTSDVYGNGDMERRLGARVPASAFIATKLGTDLESKPPRKRFGLDHLRPAFERSRDRLRRERLDVVLLHNPSVSALRASEPVDFLKELKRLGALRAWGVSAGTAEVARLAVTQGADVVEVTYNLFWSTELHDISGTIAGRGAAIFARSVLAHGLLAGAWSDAKTFPEGDHRRERWTESDLRRRLAQLDALRAMTEVPAPPATPVVSTPPIAATDVPIAQGELVEQVELAAQTEQAERTEPAGPPPGPPPAPAVSSLRAAALRFVLANQLVTTAVLGPRSVRQLEELVEDAGAGPPYLRDTVLAELAARLRGAGVLT